jgi:hypothetical protein
MVDWMMEWPYIDLSNEEDRDIVESHINRKCAEKECKNYAEKGFIYCVNHLHGFPKRIDDKWFELYEKLKLLEDV